MQKQSCVAKARIASSSLNRKQLNNVFFFFCESKQVFKYTGAEEKGFVTVLIELLWVLKENHDNEGNQYRGCRKKKVEKRSQRSTLASCIVASCVIEISQQFSRYIVFFFTLDSSYVAKENGNNVFCRLVSQNMIAWFYRFD